MKSFKIIITLILFCSFSATFAQDSLNKHGYIMIPKQLSFQKEPNQYDLNNLLKDYLEKHDFTVFIQGDSKIKNIQPCDILKLDAEKSGFFTTTITLNFSDCYGNTIYTSTEGKSKLKEFKPAYYDAFRKALKDPNIQEHKFNKKPSDSKVKE